MILFGGCLQFEDTLVSVGQVLGIGDRFYHLPAD
jgi:hypothetical protein